MADMFSIPPQKLIFSLGEWYAAHVRHLRLQTKSPPQSSDSRLRLFANFAFARQTLLQAKEAAAGSDGAFLHKENMFWGSQRRDRHAGPVHTIYWEKFVHPFEKRKQIFSFHVFDHD